MNDTAASKVIITGTGRTGTTFLVQLLTELGLPTGYTPETWRRDYDAHCAAGLEHDIEDPAAPYIVKNPALCTTLAEVMARGRVRVVLALVPVRRLEDAALSRARVGGRGDTPGGLVGTADPARQAQVLAENFHRLMETLAAHDIPHVLLHFPRFAQDANYAYERLRPLCGDLTREEFLTRHARVARPQLIHRFPTGGPPDAGRPAEAYRAAQRTRRLRKLARRVLVGGLLIGAGWIAAK